MKNRVLLIAMTAAFAGGIIAGCGSGPDQSREDATDTRNVDKNPPAVVAFNNHYPNVETKCAVPGQRLYVASTNAATGNNILVVPDERCR